jgi:NAD(P)-dependent dehydrogenase (short-subunit alcohol dehydrogenase family)
MAKLNGKVAVVTGGSSGIGLAAAKQLIQEGAQVVITGRNRDALDRAAVELGPKAFAVVADTAKLSDLDGLVEKVRSLGGLDFLFFNAGIAQFAPLEAVTEKFYDDMLSINTKGAFFTTQRLVPLFRPGGSIVFNTSVVNVKGLPNTSVYSATKAALRSLARTLAAELLPKGIRVNAVSPGPIATPIFAKSGIPQATLDEMAAGFREMVPMKRFGTAEEVAKIVLFLGFDATFTTGAELPVDGGLSQL